MFQSSIIFFNLQKIRKKNGGFLYLFFFFMKQYLLQVSLSIIWLVDRCGAFRLHGHCYFPWQILIKHSIYSSVKKWQFWKLKLWSAETEPHSFLFFILNDVLLYCSPNKNCFQTDYAEFYMPSGKLGWFH